MEPSRFRGRSSPGKGCSRGQILGKEKRIASGWGLEGGGMVWKMNPKKGVSSDKEGLRSH